MRRPRQLFRPRCATRFRKESSSRHDVCRFSLACACDVTVPEQASADQIETRRRRAEEALAQVKSGKEFAQVAAGFSDGKELVVGG